jgi:predicted AlkP superfamily pyrophosphatase or phosphodiesterase
MKLRVLFLALLLTFPIALAALKRVAIAIVLDGCSCAMLKKATPYFSGGLHELLTHGTNYEQARFYSACTSTGPGHTTLSTGAMPAQHGIVDNNWIDAAGNKVKCDAGDPQTDAILAINGTHTYGASAKQIKCDTLSEQMHFAHAGQVIAISLKRRAAICLAGKMGKAYWFNDAEAQFTTSRAYASQLPPWIERFNRVLHAHRDEGMVWKLRFPSTHPGYSFCDKEVYKYTAQPSLIGTHLKCVPIADDEDDDTLCKPYSQSPYALFDLLNLSLIALHQYEKSTEDNLLLWIGVSNLDKIGHIFGPTSIEYVDLLYQLDWALGIFMQQVKRLFHDKELLFVLTSDHGYMPLPETLQDKGYYSAKRIVVTDLVNTIHQHLKESQIAPIDICIKYPYVYIPPLLLQKYTTAEQTKILSTTKKVLLACPAIRAVCTLDELVNQVAPVPTSLIPFYRGLIFPDRAAQFYLLSEPYCYIGKYHHGATHKGPYNYTTHVPLIWYTPHRAQKTFIDKPVNIASITTSLAAFFGIEPPSAAFNTLLVNPYRTFSFLGRLWQ